MRATSIGLCLLAACIVAVSMCSDSPWPHHLQARRLGFSSEPSSSTTDLLSEPCAPGSSVTTGVNLAPGTTADSASLTFTGEAFGEFTIVSTTQTGTWFAVTARNTGTDAIPLSATFNYGATP